MRTSSTSRQSIGPLIKARNDTHVFNFISHGHSPAQNDDPPEFELICEAGVEAHGASLAEASEDDAIRRSPGLDLLTNEVCQRARRAYDALLVDPKASVRREKIVPISSCK